MRLLYFADIRFPLERANGIQTMETCHALAERGHTVQLIVRPDTQEPPRDPFEYYGLSKLSRFVIERAPASGPPLPATARRVAYLAFALGRASGTARADVLMTRDLAVASLLLRLPSRPPVVYESHGYAPEVTEALPDLVSTAQPPSRRKIERLARREAHVWKRADGYVTITAALARVLEKRYGPRQHLAVVPDGARVVADSSRDTDPRDSRPVRDPRDPSPVKDSDHGHGTTAATVAYAGHLYAWKGVDVLLEALARLPGVRGLIVGGHAQEPDLARLQALADRLEIRDRVTFTGYVPPSAVPPLLAQADVLVIPNPPSAISTHATSPLKLFEYMAARRAIVASDLPSIREVLWHDDNAWLVAAGDPAALASGIKRLADDPGLRARLARAAGASVAEYSWARRAERLEALFIAVLAAR